MAAAGPMPPSLAPEQAALDQDSTVSSPLSDVDDGDEEASLEGMHLNTSRHREEDDPASDSDSNLSEANDTEAETERLHDTPRSERHRDVTARQYSDTQIFQNTPSKLQKTYSIVDVAGDGDDDLSDHDIVSMLSSRRGETTPTIKPGKLVETTPELDSQDSAENKKRKRSLGAEQSDSDQPLRKRTSSMATADRAKHITPREDGEEDDEHSTQPSGNITGAESGIEDAQELPPPVGKPKTSRGPASPSKKSTTKKKATRNGAKRKTENREDEEVDTHEEGAAVEESEQQAEDRAAAEAEQEAEAAARDAEELERKQAALEEWNELEAKFGLFRERLYKDRLEHLEMEEQSLQADPPTHSEYLLMKQCLDERLEARLQQINKENELVMAALERVSIARKAQIWNQFYQGVREKRGQYLEELNREWFMTQNARRSAHSVPEYGIHFPADQAQRTRNAVAYNTEVSYLSGLAKHEGFPAVPPIRGASGAEIEEDLEAMRRFAHLPQRPPAQPSENYQAVSLGGTLGPAGEQFLKNTPWANPNHLSHQAASVPPQAVAAPSAGLEALARLPAVSRANGQGHPHSASAMADVSPEVLSMADVLTHDMPHSKRAASVGIRRGSKAAQAQEAPPRRDTAMTVAS
ncbi:hypothetical protein ACRALDRAFT_1061919 [Sodiomyces alcalophilus JCM 7366]|uniref:uncharacterized protein n=1 Tax=Sodiomyces alcalophilus JCM 7366 TaxID=591952 RepID=UPI0039B6390B